MEAAWRGAVEGNADAVERNRFLPQRHIFRGQAVAAGAVEAVEKLDYRPSSGAVRLLPEGALHAHGRIDNGWERRARRDLQRTGEEPALIGIGITPEGSID